MIAEDLIFKKLEYNLENLAFLREKIKLFDSYFDPPLSHLLDIDSYAEKLLLNAYIETLFIGDIFIGLYAVYVNNKVIEEAYLTLIAISNMYEGLGYGQLLMDRCVYISKTYGFKNIKLEVYKYNEKAIRLYKKNGFVIISDNNKELISAHYMIKNLV